MTRQTLDSKNAAGSSLAVRDSAAPPDFASWLTSDLRVKGASVPPAAAQSHPSESAPAALGPDPEQLALARWLTADLRPRGSTPPDSLAPQMVTAPLALVPAADLQAEDLAVLPARAGARSRAQASRRAAALLALLLLGGGVVLFGRGRPQGDVVAEPTAAAAPQGPLIALPPPAPDSVLPEVVLPPEPVERRRSGPTPEADTPDPGDSADRAGGVAVARFPDLPLPTLSQLAREEREQAKVRDEALRRGAKRADP